MAGKIRDGKGRELSLPLPWSPVGDPSRGLQQLGCAAHPMIYDSLLDIWTVVLPLEPGRYKYKFFTEVKGAIKVFCKIAEAQSFPGGDIRKRGSDSGGEGSMTKEEERLQESRERRVHWRRWGPYLSERAWGTVREDYSPYGTAWDYLLHDHARSRAYRWGEDGLAGRQKRHAPGVRRAPLVEAVLPLRGNAVAHGRSSLSPVPSRAAARSQPRVDPPLQCRRHLYA